MDIEKTLAISAAGMSAQSDRLTVIAQNLANQDSTGTTPGADPYRRKTISFGEHLDSTTGEQLVDVTKVGTDPSPFPLRYDPSNPAANAQGYVKMPNVNPVIEMMDMRAAERSYAANLAVMQTARGMLTRTIAMLK